jgi:hypothetical protein
MPKKMDKCDQKEAKKMGPSAFIKHEKADIKAAQVKKGAKKK